MKKMIPEAVFFAAWLTAGSAEVEPKEVNEEGIRLCHATGIA